MEGFLSVKEATKSYAQGCKAKAATSIGKLFGSTFCCKCRTCKTYCGSCIPSRFDDGNSAGGRAVYW